MLHPTAETLAVASYVAIQGGGIGLRLEDGQRHHVAAADEMLAFMQARKPVGRVDLKALVNEGRA